MPPIYQPPFPGQRALHYQMIRFGPGPGHPFISYLLLAAVVFFVVLLLVSLFNRRAPARAMTGGLTTASGPMQILDERFARGEIDADDYTARRALLTKSP